MTPGSSDKGLTERIDVDMHLDAEKSAPKKKHSHHGSKIEKKKAHRKARNSIVFPSIKRKHKGGAGTSAGKR
jgi:hypothetical protein